MPKSIPQATAIKTIMWLALAIVMFVAGLAHFTHFEVYMAFMPKWMPAAASLVYISAVIEMALAAALLWHRTTKLAAWGLIAALLTMSLANINHAIQGGIADPALPAFFANPTLAWIRLPMQLVFIAWAWWFTRNPVPRFGHSRQGSDALRRVPTRSRSGKITGQ